MARKKTGGPLGPAIDLLSSFGLACVLLACLFVLVLAATLAYKDIGEAGVKQEYFIPWLVSFDARVPYSDRVLPVPFPGGSTVFSLLALNLLLGGLVRIRKTWRTAGVIVGHLGIVGLLVAGVVNFTMSDYGMLVLYEGEVGNHYRDFNAFELAVWNAAEEEDVRELLVGDADLRSCARNGRTFSHPDLPFEIELSGFLLNCRALPKGPNWEADSPVVEGWALEELPDADDPNDNYAGIVARVTTPEGTRTGLLTARDYVAWTVEAGGETWGLHLHKERHPLPFTVELLDAHREDHPGTSMPRVYHSDINLLEDGGEREVRISMNHPLREQGHVLFQSNWGQDPRRGEYSGFSVARNPSDHWPLYSMFVLMAGLLWAFGHRLVGYIESQTRKRERGPFDQPPPPPPPPATREKHETAGAATPVSSGGFRREEA